MSGLDTTQTYTLAGYVQGFPGDFCAAIVSLGGQSIVNQGYPMSSNDGYTFAAFTGSIQPSAPIDDLVVTIRCDIGNLLYYIFGEQVGTAKFDEITLMGPNPAC